MTIKASRRRRITAPPILAKELELQHLVPSDYQLPDIEDDLKVIETFWMDGGIHVDKTDINFPEKRMTNSSFKTAPPDVLRVIEKFKTLLESLPIDFKKHIISEAERCEGEVFNFLGMMGIYHNFLESRRRLRLLYEEASRRSEGSRKKRWTIPRAPAVYGTLVVDDEGEFEINIDPLFIELRGVAASRIGVCQVCEHVFWAERKDQPCCSKACAHVLRNRRYRKRYSQGFYQGANFTPKEATQLKLRRESAKKGK